MRAHHTLPRLYTSAPLALEVAVTASLEQFNYLATVLRLRDDAEILLFNGKDGEFKTRLSFVGKKKLQLIPVEHVRAQTAPCTLTLLFAPLKVGRLDYLIQKAVEMGAGIITPTITQHTQNHHISLEKMRANAIEACEQCGILNVPLIHAPTPLFALLENWQGDTQILFCDEAAQPHDLLSTLTPLQGKNIAVLIGPEGGFSQAERDALYALSFVTPISLGSRILRADTAVVAALALVEALAGKEF